MIERKLIVINIFIMIPVIQNTWKNLACITKYYVLKDFALTVKTARLSFMTVFLILLSIIIWNVSKMKVGKSFRDLRKEGKTIGVPFIVTCHPHLKHLDKLIQKNMRHVHADAKVRSVFTPVLFASFCTARNFRSHLKRFKLYPRERNRLKQAWIPMFLNL